MPQKMMVKRYILVFEFVDGDNMDNLLNHKGRFSVEEVVSIMRQVCEALKYAHSMRIVHRDLKLSNVIVSKDGEVKVVDFGIARQLKDTISRLTGRETSGTFAYMAPEQHLGDADFRSDIYSLGVCMYEMLTGELPFKGPDFYLQKEKMAYVPVKEVITDLPDKVNEIINKCLQVDKEKRYQTIDELMEDLRTIM